MITLLVLFGWLFMCALGFPIGLTLIFVPTVYFIYEGHGLLFTVDKMIGALNSFPLLAIPLFILTAVIFEYSGVTMRIFRFAEVLVGHITGGLGHVNVIASLLFAGMSGSAVADAAGLGKLEISAMRRAGFDDDFSGCVTAASSLLGPLIPPSITMVLYGVVANTSIGRLFLGGIIPGVMSALGLMVVVAIISKKRAYPVRPRATFKEVIVAFKESALALLTPFIIIGGIFSGFFSPTEAATVSCIYSLILGVIVYRTINLRKFWAVLCETVELCSTFAILIGGAGVFSYIIALERMPQLIVNFFLHYTSGVFSFIMIANVLIFILGMFLDGMSLLLLVIPVLVQVALQFNIDPTYFGIMLILNLMIAGLTPPMGGQLFIVCQVSNIPFGVLARSIWVWLLPCVVTLVLLVFFPSIATFIPNLAF